MHWGALRCTKYGVRLETDRRLLWSFARTRVTVGRGHGSKCHGWSGSHGPSGKPIACLGSMLAAVGRSTTMVAAARPETAKVCDTPESHPGR